jgi:protein SCO1/2
MEMSHGVTFWMFSATRLSIRNSVLSISCRDFHANLRNIRISEKSRSSVQYCHGQKQKRCYAVLPERNAIGTFTPTAAALFLPAGVGLAIYFCHEKARLDEERGKLEILCSMNTC